MLSEGKTTDFPLPIFIRRSAITKLVPKASILESIQRVLFWKDRKDTGHCLMQRGVSDVDTEVTVKVWLQAVCSF